MSAKWTARTPPKRQVEGSNPSGPELNVENVSQTSGRQISITIEKKSYDKFVIQLKLCHPGKISNKS